MTVASVFERERSNAISQQLDAPVQIGQVVAAKYRVDRILGAGGMGVVVAATHLQLDQLVALKFIRREVITNPEVVSRFEREARSAVRLKSEHVARIIDVGRLDDHTPYIVMEYLDGQDLAGLLQQGPLSIQAACDFIVQACDAIAEAHSIGIIHRDLKPGNLFLANTSHGRQMIKVLDFGISKSPAVANDPSMTRTHAVMGSPAYMSPEQMRSPKSVDARSDIWSLGVILYQLVAGHVPFDADTFTALCLKVAFDPHPPLSALPTPLPPGFEAVVDRALRKDPAQRHASVGELAQALAPFGSAQGRERADRLTSSLPMVQPAGSQHMRLSTPSTLRDAAGQVRPGEPAGGRRRARRAILVAAALGGAAAIGLAIGATRGGGPRGAASAPTSPPVLELQATPLPPPPMDARSAVLVIDAGTPEPPDASSSAVATPIVAAPVDGGVATPPVRGEVRRPKVLRDARPKDSGSAADPPFDPFRSPY